MSELETETSLQIIQDLEALFSEEAPCEGQGHGSHRSHPYAEETGEWYLYLHCPNCGFDRVALVCNTMKETCSGDNWVACRQCHMGSPAWEIVQKTIRKGTAK